MAKDLEDFLKRAAQRRAENAAYRKEVVQRQQGANVKAAPEYTNRRLERQLLSQADAEEGGGASSKKEPTSEFVSRAEKIFDHEVGNLDKSPSFAGIQAARPQVAMSVVEPIFELFRDPQRLAQAFILREILDRPSDRW